MSDPTPSSADGKTNDGQPNSKFVVFQSYRGVLTLPNGTEYEFREIRPHPLRKEPKDHTSPIIGYWYEGFPRFGHARGAGSCGLWQSPRFIEAAGTRSLAKTPRFRCSIECREGAAGRPRTL